MTSASLAFHFTAASERLIVKRTPKCIEQQEYVSWILYKDSAGVNRLMIADCIIVSKTTGNRLLL